MARAGAAQEVTGRRCWNTHLLWSLLPKGADGAAPKVVYVTRDGRDVTPSAPSPFISPPLAARGGPNGAARMGRRRLSASSTT